VHEALHRAQAIAADERICAIVAAQHRLWWQGLPLSGSNVIAQPENRGTANGILLALLHIAERDSGAQIVLLPSDHHVQDEATLAKSLRWALGHLRARPNEILLFGVEPDKPDPELGYIVPGDRSTYGTSGIAEFIEKPAAAVARKLIEDGALWNTFIIAASAATLLDLLERRFPDIVREMRDAVRRDLRHPVSGATAELYTRLPTIDFSKHVMSKDTDANFRVHSVPRCGWSDLGTSKRVAETLRRLRRNQRPVKASVSLNTHISLAARLEGLRYSDQRP
jgi:mannose-1-phosphate guanylyltransferase